MSADDEYAQSRYIPDGDSYLPRWQAAAEAFRESHDLKELDVPYGTGGRCCYDIYHPARASKGTVMFVHGGYWMALSPKAFSHLAAGAVAAGYACVMPSYTLAPDARISQMTQEIAAAVAAIARRTVGPIYLTGHSAGGHLVARMACADMTGPWMPRLARVMPVSPLGDLAPLMATTMNDTLGIDAREAQRESPLHHARQDVPVTVWVGAAERPAFLDQARTLAEAWQCDHVIDKDRHHFDVIEGFEHPRSAIMRAMLS